MTGRYRLPEGLTPAEERAVIAALEEYFAPERGLPDAWLLAGRLDATALGAVQSRRLSSPGETWRRLARGHFARRGTPPLHGRGDAK